MSGYTILVYGMCFTFSFIGVTVQRESCVTPRNERGSCIPIKSCEVLYQLVQQPPVSQQNVDYLRESQCGFDGNTPKLCCPAEKSIQSENCTTPNNEKAECISLYSCPVLTKALATHDDASIEFVRKSNCGGTTLEPMVCCGSLSNFSTPNSMTTSSNDVKNELLSDRRYCGYQHSDDYISTKNNTGISEFPWLAALVYGSRERDNNENETVCGGSLISNRYVLTAAHCVLNTAPYKLISVRLGEYNLKNQTDCVEEHSIWHECIEPPQDFVIAKSIPHPQFNGGDKFGDIALLRLERAVCYSDYIRPICLPTPETKSAEVGDIFTSTGWGQSAYHGEQVETKKRILMRLISNEECVANDRQYKTSVTENHFCTTDLETDAEYPCIGDSGGPVMISRRNQWQQEGIISFVVKCHSGYPNVHTKISKYLDWIKENIEP